MKPITPLRTLPAARLASTTAPMTWLVDGLFPAAAAGILGGAPKTGKSFFALDLAVAVASGTACAGRFAVASAGRVLLLCAEDPAAVLVERLDALARGRDHSLAALPIDVIIEPSVKLPDAHGRLAATVARARPRLLVLDPLIRLHRADENSATEMAAVLDGLRALARKSGVAILLVHHARKASAGGAPGNGLRGSSDLWAFGDSNLYLRRAGDTLELRLEHRAAAAPPPLRLRLSVEERVARFVVQDGQRDDPLGQRVLTLLKKSSTPMSTVALREALAVRKEVLVTSLQTLAASGRISRVGRLGWTTPVENVPVPESICGNGNTAAD